MEPWNRSKTPELVLLRFSLYALVMGLIAGLLGAIQYFVPEIIPGLGFQKIRPIHVTFLVAWILGSAMALVWFVLKREFNASQKQGMLGVAIPYFFAFTGVLIFLHYLVGRFGGREYWEFPQYLATGIFTTWLCFIVVFFRMLRNITDPWPAYIWMWLTGVIFFLVTFAEGNLWVFSYIRGNVVKDITIQWKSQGALVGSWNMLVYGLSLYLSEKISGDKSTSRSNLAFASFILGFVNLLFGWAHHIYIVPCPLWIRLVSYAISMTELILIFKIIHQALKPVRPVYSSGIVYNYQVLYKYAALWIKYNLFLAVLISIPAVNLFTHGTYVTVAHAMGSTIGINTFILLSVIAYALKPVKASKRFEFLVVLMHNCLLVFWTSLIAAGLIRGIFTEKGQMSFNQIQDQVQPFLYVFALSGFFLVLFLIGLVSGKIFFRKNEALLK